MESSSWPLVVVHVRGDCAIATSFGSDVDGFDRGKVKARVLNATGPSEDPRVTHGGERVCGCDGDRGDGEVARGVREGERK